MRPRWIKSFFAFLERFGKGKTHRLAFLRGASYAIFHRLYNGISFFLYWIQGGICREDGSFVINQILGLRKKVFAIWVPACEHRKPVSSSAITWRKLWMLPPTGSRGLESVLSASDKKRRRRHGILLYTLYSINHLYIALTCINPRYDKVKLPAERWGLADQWIAPAIGPGFLMDNDILLENMSGGDPSSITNGTANGKRTC